MTGCNPHHISKIVNIVPDILNHVASVAGELLTQILAQDVLQKNYEDFSMIADQIESFNFKR